MLPSSFQENKTDDDAINIDKDLGDPKKVLIVFDLNINYFDYIFSD